MFSETRYAIAEESDGDVVEFRHEATTKPANYALARTVNALRASLSDDYHRRGDTSQGGGK